MPIVNSHPVAYIGGYFNAEPNRTEPEPTPKGEMKKEEENIPPVLYKNQGYTTDKIARLIDPVLSGDINFHAFQEDFFEAELEKHMNVSLEDKASMVGVSVVRKMGSSAVNVLGSLAGLYTARLVLQYLPGLNLSPSQRGLSAEAIAQVVAPTVNSAVNQFVHATVDTLGLNYGTLQAALPKAFGALQKKTDPYVQKLPAQTKAKVLQLDKNIIRSLQLLEASQGLKAVSDPILGLIKRRFLMAASNLQPKDLLLIHPAQKTDKLRMQEKLKALIEKQPAKNQPMVRAMIDSIRSNSEPKLSHPKRPQYFLLGKPGTGKTTFVEELGAALGIPVCKVSLSKDMHPRSLAGMELVNGDRSDKVNQGSSDEPHSHYIGHIPQQLIQSGIGNPIIFMDEAPEALQASNSVLVGLMKKLTDTNKKSLLLDYGAIDLDWSRATIILAGNAPIRDSALQSRFQTIEFPALTIEQKTQAADKTLADCLKGLQEAGTSSDLIEQISQDMKQSLPVIIEKNAKIHDGARELISAIEVMVSYFKGLRSEAIEFTDDDVTDQITRLIDASKIPEETAQDNAQVPVANQVVNTMPPMPVNRSQPVIVQIPLGTQNRAA